MQVELINRVFSHQIFSYRNYNHSSLSHPSCLITSTNSYLKDRIPNAPEGSSSIIQRTKSSTAKCFLPRTSFVESRLVQAAFAICVDLIRRLDRLKGFTFALTKRFFFPVYVLQVFLRRHFMGNLQARLRQVVTVAFEQWERFPNKMHETGDKNAELQIWDSRKFITRCSFLDMIARKIDSGSF